MFGKLQNFASRVHAIATIAFSLALLLAGFAMPSSAQAAGKVVSCEHYHTVQQGEHIASIADYYSIDYYAIAVDSGLKYPYYLAVGQRLCINGATLPVSQVPATQAPVSQAPPMVEEPAMQAPPATQAPVPAQVPPATQAPAPAQVPPATQAPAPAQVPPATQAPAPAQIAGPAPSGPQAQQQASYSCTYVVKSGDMLSRIARYHGVSMRALAKSNGLKNINRIYVGQHLNVPC